MNIECKFSQQISIEDKSEFHEEDPSRAITWSFYTLFEIYVFADRYDTLPLRQQVMHFIQLKMNMCTPRRHPGPTFPVIKFAIEQLPDTSPLRMFLATLVGKDISLATGRHSLNRLAIFPSDFLAECLIQSKVKTRAVLVKFAGHEEGDDGKIHSSDILNACEWSPHRFHEHDKDGKQTHIACYHLWNFLRTMYCMADEFGADDEEMNDA